MTEDQLEQETLGWLLEEKLDILRGMLHEFDYSGFLTGGQAETLSAEWMI